MKPNLIIKQDIKKHIKKFINAQGQIIEGGAEECFGNKVGHNLARVGRPDFPSK